MTRKHALTGVLVVAVVLLLTTVGAYAFSDRTLASASEVEAALPAQQNMSNWSPSRGVLGILTPPKGDKNGKLVLTGGKLDDQCAVYRKESNGWVCAGLQGLGTIGYAYKENVDTRVGSMVLAYEDDDAAEAAWQTMTARTHAEFPRAKQGELARVGDESASFTLSAGTLVVLRSGSVVAQAMSSGDYGFRTGPDSSGWHNPIKMWSSLQAGTAASALGG